MNKEQILENALREIVDLTGTTNRSAFNQLKDAVEGCQEIAEAALDSLPIGPDQPANTTDSDSVFIGPEAGLDTGFIVPQPPKSAGVKTEIESLKEDVFLRDVRIRSLAKEVNDLTAQAQDFEAEIIAFANWIKDMNWIGVHDGKYCIYLTANRKTPEPLQKETEDLLTQFRNQKPRG